MNYFYFAAIFYLEVGCRDVKMNRSVESLAVARVKVRAKIYK